MAGLRLAGSTLALGTFWQQVPSWLLSTAFHLAFILILASYTVVGGLAVAIGNAGHRGPVATAMATAQDLDDAPLEAAVESPPAEQQTR